MKQNYLANRLFNSMQEIEKALSKAWRKMLKSPEELQSIFADSMKRA